MKYLNNKNAFTLIELLVSVAITGILVSIAVVNFQAYKEASYLSECQLAARNLLTAGQSRLIEPNFSVKSLEINGSGVVSLTGATSLADIAPGYVHPSRNGLYILLHVYGSSGTYPLTAHSSAAHCKGPNARGYPGSKQGARCGSGGALADSCYTSNSVALYSAMGCP